MVIAKAVIMNQNIFPHAIIITYHSENKSIAKFQPLFLSKFFEPFSLVVGDQVVDDIIDVSFEHLFELVKRRSRSCGR